MLHHHVILSYFLIGEGASLVVTIMEREDTERFTRVAVSKVSQRFDSNRCVLIL